MIEPITSVTIQITDLNDEVHDFLLEAPNDENPFEFQPQRVKIQPDYRDRNYVQRLGKEKYEILFQYRYQSHEMDLRVLLTSKKITLKAPPDFIGDYTQHEVLFINEEAIRDYVEGLAVGGAETSIPSGEITLEFLSKEPMEWDELMALKWNQQEIHLQPDPPQNFSVTLNDDIAQCTWEAVPDVDGYNVYFNIDEGGYTKQNAVLIEGLTFDSDSLEPGSYQAYVTSFANELESEPSNTELFSIQGPLIEQFNALIFTKGGSDRGIYKMDLGDFSDQQWTQHGQSGHPSDLSVDSVNRFIMANGGGSNPRTHGTDLDSPAGTMSTIAGPGSWNSGHGYTTPANGNVWICDTFERIGRYTYAGSHVQTYQLFSTRQGRPNKCEVDLDDGTMVVNVGSETNRLLSFDLADVTNNETELTIPGTSIFKLDLARKKVYYRTGADPDQIRSINYDGTGDQLLYDHGESIRWFGWSVKTPDFLFYSTETGLYVLNLLTETAEQFIPHTDIWRFDWDYTP